MRLRSKRAWLEVICPAVLLLSSLSTSALAANCKNDGGLLFLGTNKSDSRSIWVSGTVAGDYRLDAAQGNQTVDTWSRSSTGLHLSTSPVVSSGNGGTHKLYGVDGGSDCLIDTQNQKRDFQLPDNIKPPSLVKPPISRLFPNFGRPVPPIAVVPPSGVMPGLPGPIAPPSSGITPPVGGLPPAGFNLGRPGTAAPPIGTVPSGVLPSAPGGVTPPIGTLPPSGGGTGAPGTVTPPIGTLPPGSRNPNQPALPAGFVPVRRADGQVISYCVDPRSAEETQTANAQTFCTREQLLAAGRLQQQDEVPITPGRDLIEPTL